MSPVGTSSLTIQVTECAIPLPSLNLLFLLSFPVHFVVQAKNLALTLGHFLFPFLDVGHQGLRLVLVSLKTLSVLSF